MKVLFKMAGLGAIALMALVSCQREQSLSGNSSQNPSDENTVKAKFTLSVSTSTGEDVTKTSAAMAQVNSPFLGMDAVHLLTYSLGNTNKPNFYYNPWKSGTEKQASTRDYDLGTLFTPGAVTQQQSTRTVELSLPLETDCVVLYGKATKSNSSDLQGAVTLAGDPADLTSLKFSLVPRLDDETKFKVGAVAFTRIINYLLCAGLVQEVRVEAGGQLISGFWKQTTGYADRSYGFWFPLEGAPAEPGTTNGQSDGNNHVWHQGQISWKQLGQMYRYTYDGDLSTDPATVVNKTGGAPGFLLPPLGEVLGDAYESITTIQTKGTTLKELRSGSAASILRTMEDLYTIVDRGATTTATSWQEQVCKLLSQVIKGRLDEFFVRSSNGFFFKSASGDGKMTADEVSDLIAKLENFKNPTDGWNINNMYAYFDASYFPYTDEAGYNPGFPVNIGLPLGAAIMNCDVANDFDKNVGYMEMDAFSFTTEIPAYGMGEASFPIQNYRYPPELMYYGNSEIRVTSEVFTTWPATLTGWDGAGAWAGWGNINPGKVTSTTRSVAMIDHINYGTALLKSRVMFGSGVTVLKDNNHEIHGSEDDNSIPVDGLVVTGIIVGGQPDDIGWDYTRRADDPNVKWIWDDATGRFYNGTVGTEVSFANNGFDKMIYDKVPDLPIAAYVAEPTSGTDPITPIYTICWDNYDATKDKDQQADVYVALEIRNDTGKDFWGELNLVRKGGTFYLVGKLSLASGVKPANYKKVTGTDDWDLSRSNYNYPPYNPETGATLNVPRVLMQDYMTTANLVLGVDALKHAYVTMPDLRSSQISLGVAIDMSWSKGMSFDVNMGTL